MSLKYAMKQLRPARIESTNYVDKVQHLLESRGSGGGAEGTKTTECAQCVYAAAMFNGEKLKVGDKLDPTLFGKYASKFEIDESLKKIETDLTDSWVESSILIATAMKKLLKGTSYTFHRGSPLVSEIESKFNELNKAQKPKPFSNVNKWSPADIYAVKDGASFNFSQYSNLGEFTNELKELYDKKTLVGISLKKAKGNVTIKENNITGFIRRPVKYKGYDKPRDFFSSKDMYIYLGDIKMQLRTFSRHVGGWQGEIKGKSAAAGKIGGGVLESIMVKNSSLSKFKYNNAELKKLAIKPTPIFLNELYELHLSCGGKEPKNNFIEKAKANKIGKVSGADWRYSKFRSMFYVAQLEANKYSGNQICDNIAAYAMSESNDSAPHVVFK